MTVANIMPSIPEISNIDEMEDEERQRAPHCNCQSNRFGEWRSSKEDDDEDEELGGVTNSPGVDLLPEEATETSSTDDESSSNHDATVDLSTDRSSSPPPDNVASSLSPPPPSMAMQEHLGKHRQYWRDILLGVNDGIISTFLLVAGVAGAGQSSRSILLTAIAGTVAGAVSMCAGEYLATKSQNEVLEGEIKLERLHVIHHRQEEMKELRGLLEIIGITNDQVALRQQLFQFYDGNPDSLLKVMIALEFGVLKDEVRSPWIAGLTNLALFIWGALPSVVPFIFAKHANYGLIAAAIATMAALLLVGAVKTWATRGNCLAASVENLVIAAVGGGLAYGVGILFDNYIVH